MFSLCHDVHGSIIIYVDKLDMRLVILNVVTDILPEMIDATCKLSRVLILPF